MFFDEWKALRRHKHPVTVWDVVRLNVLQGELQEMAERVPAPEKIRESEKPFREVFRALSFLLKTFPLRRSIAREAKRIATAIEQPAEIIRPKYQSADDDPRRIPGVTWYAYLVDLFGHEYGWTEEQVRALPYSALSEYVLAIESRRVYESSRRVLESSPTSQGVEELNKYPRRKMDIPRELLDEYFRKQREKIGAARVH